MSGPPAIGAPESLQLWLELRLLQDRYIDALDNDRLEDWTALFVEDCLYEIVPRENEAAGLPVGVIRCVNRRMLEDRVVSLRHANIYEEHSYRHFLSAQLFTCVDTTTVDMTSNYVVIQTSQAGQSQVYQTGRYQDRVVREGANWRFRRRRVIFDTSRVQTLLATPI